MSLSVKDRELLLKMIVRCKKAKGKKFRPVEEPKLKVDGVISTDFAESEVARGFGRTETNRLRKQMLEVLDNA